MTTKNELKIQDPRTQKTLDTINLGRNARRYLEDTHLEYCTRFEITDPVCKDALLGALYFYYMTFNQNIEPKIKPQYYKIYTDTLKALGILDAKTIVNEIIKKMSAEKKLATLIEDV